jgi:predicted HicB family RNase H-like nuclease
MASRPTKPTDDKSEEYIHVRIPPELKAKLKVAAKSSGMDLSNYCRAAMVEKARRDGHKI